MGFDQKSWVENYVQGLCPLKITREKVDEEINNIVTFANELFSSQSVEKHVELIPEKNMIIFPGRKLDSYLVYNVDIENNEVKIIKYKSKELTSKIQKVILINCKVDEYVVNDEPSIAMDEMAFNSLKDAINYAFSKILI